MQSRNKKSFKTRTEAAQYLDRHGWRKTGTTDWFLPASPFRRIRIENGDSGAWFVRFAVNADPPPFTSAHNDFGLIEDERADAYLRNFHTHLHDAASYAFAGAHTSRRTRFPLLVIDDDSPNFRAAVEALKHNRQIIRIVKPEPDAEEVREAIRKIDRAATAYFLNREGINETITCPRCGRSVLKFSDGSIANHGTAEQGPCVEKPDAVAGGLAFDHKTTDDLPPGCPPKARYVQTFHRAFGFEGRDVGTAIRELNHDLQQAFEHRFHSDPQVHPSTYAFRPVILGLELSHVVFQQYGIIRLKVTFRPRS